MILSNRNERFGKDAGPPGSNSALKLRNVFLARTHPPRLSSRCRAGVTDCTDFGYGNDKVENPRK